MIPRYTPQDFQDLWSPLHKFQTWLDVELAACEAMEGAKLVPQGTAVEIRPVREQIRPERIDEIERTTHHDVIAFLTHIEELAGAPARFLHLGMTSSDVLDTSLNLLLIEAGERILERTDQFLQALSKRVVEHKQLPMIGRSHGIHAEPITFGLALAGHYVESLRAKRRLRSALEEVRHGKIAGAVGTYSHLSPAIEHEALKALGLKPETVSTQIIPRDRHAAFTQGLAMLATAIERLAVNVRHWQRSEVQEAEEYFARGQKGSSAMPHKRNPILSENLCGLARVVRAAVAPTMENTVLWHERDISHSSVERMLLPDITSTVAFMLDRATKLIGALVVYPERMQKNLEKSAGLWASEGVLLQLVQSGVARQEAYVWVQRQAMRALAGEDFASLLAADPDIQRHLSESAIRKEFDLSHALRHVDAVIERALAEGAGHGQS